MTLEWLRYVSAFVSLATLAGCAAGDAQLAARAKSELLGLNTSDLRMCAGLPNGTAGIKDGEIWMYEHGAANPGGVSLPGIPVMGAQITGPSGGYCRVQLRMVKERVTEVSFAGATDFWGARDAVCGPMIRNCLEYRQHRVARAAP
jgi:hypothetical protein